MNARDILVEALKAMGADGLCNTDLECGCALDDLAPCYGTDYGCLDIEKCVPAKCAAMAMVYCPMEASP